MNNNLDSYCGMYCGACDIQTAYTSGHKDKFSAFWTERVLKAFARAQGAAIHAPDDLELKCHGCKSDTLFINCRHCTIRACARDKKVEHCIECADFPCATYRERKKAEGLLPHLTLCQQNMESIKQKGVDQWLGQQEEHWQCPECQTGFAWYADRCHECHTNLRNNTFNFSFIQSALLKLGISLSALGHKKQEETVKSP